MIILLIHYLPFNYYYFFSFRALDNQVCKKKRSYITVTSSYQLQHEKKVMSDNPWLVDFAIRLFFEEIQITEGL